MSRQPSPGPSHSLAHGHIFQPVSTPSTRQKSRAYATGIAAGAEDVKYQAKYKELKRKVKEIEADNDKLHFKVLQAKRSIQRMKLERAVLYERLSAIPPSPDIHDRQALPPMHPGPGVLPHQQQPSLGQTGQHPPHHSIREHSHGMDHNDPALLEYFRSRGSARVMAGPDGRVLPMTDPPMGPGVAPSSHGLPSAHPRRSSGSGHDASRQLPPLSQLAQLEGPRGHEPVPSHTSPHMHSHAAAAPPSHSRSHSRPMSRARALGVQPYLMSAPPVPHSHQSHPSDLLPPVQQSIHSPSMTAERSRTRRHDIHELANSHVDGQTHSRQQGPPQLSPPHPQHSNDRRTSGRVHHHQRIGPGANIGHSDDRDLEREREWERDHELTRERDVAHLHSPPVAHRSRGQTERAVEHPEHIPTSRARDEHAYYHDGPSGSNNYSMLSRSGTPGSGSAASGNNGASEGLSRPDSRTQIYERSRPASYSSRASNQPSGNDVIPFVHEDGRTLPRAPPGGRSSSRKRPWSDDMEVDEEHDVDNIKTAGAGERADSGNSVPAGYAQEDRGAKRLHQDRASTTPARGADSQEDANPE